ncbi:hypothetical protein RND81_13G218400 [Saponaria officinalis]|uniref:Uncharacterized protein n=1 Tax=Saponaria officinalis TaxID=3572 RepID=A0AAW1H5M1_SAPOF
MGLSETDSSNCRRHPNHRQTPGVCSSCLREKLSKLTISPPSLPSNKINNIASPSSTFSSTPPYSSASSSTTTTTRKSPGSRHRRNGSETYVSVGMVLNSGLKKSRSVSCAPLSARTKSGANDIINDKFKSCVNACGEVDKEGNHKKINNGFLKKLIHTTSKKTKGVFVHSKTMRERSHSSTNPTAANHI